MFRRYLKEIAADRKGYCPSAGRKPRNPSIKRYGKSQNWMICTHPSHHGILPSCARNRQSVPLWRRFLCHALCVGRAGGPLVGGA
jgi:hypothetical protein